MEWRRKKIENMRRTQIEALSTIHLLYGKPGFDMEGTRT
jgi:hypothetical protein